LSTVTKNQLCAKARLLKIMHPESTDRLFIVTGGPGAGKSTLLAALAARGFATMPEGGRAIIQDQVAINGPALPWADRSAFAELMLSWDMRSYREALGMQGPVFFDRGVPDVPSYLRLCGIPIPQHVANAAETYRYHRRVFVAPPWEAIFEQDAERKQDFAEAQATYDALIEVYESLGYEMIRLPLVSPEERAMFVVEKLSL
jgi:predicted ATPase